MNRTTIKLARSKHAALGTIPAGNHFLWKTKAYRRLTPNGVVGNRGDSEVLCLDVQASEVFYFDKAERVAVLEATIELTEVPE